MKEEKIKWYTKVLNWIKGLFKKFQFDNKLFALGVDWVVSETLKRLTDAYDGNMVEGIIRNFTNVTKEKFRKFPAITNVIDEAKIKVIEDVKSRKGYSQMKLENKVKFIGEALKDWYNKNL